MKFAFRAQRNLSGAVIAIFSGSKCPTFYSPFLIASQRVICVNNRMTLERECRQAVILWRHADINGSCYLCFICPHKNINKIVNMETALGKYKGTRIDRRKDVI